ncbi:MAG: phosphate signaling complex protein PhoU [Bacilli bacterium]|jgi:phosphate transport system protein|nr:phosphate signaling complex protein PhoU [Bacilli bacterium]MCH4236243.1 phosphate signaling complex protein PhoU [Bacilli bacterium]
MRIDEELKELNQLLYQMASLVESNIHRAIDIFTHPEDDDEKYVVNDDLVDHYERLIEEKCLDIMVREKLYASDLKIVTGILKMSSDLERIGDHAEDIMEYNQKLRGLGHGGMELINHIAEIAIAMVDDSVSSFIKEDSDLAREVIARDDEVDKLYEDAQKEIITKLQNQELEPAFAINSTFILKYLERIADHSVNIAEWANYIKSGYYKDTQIF